MFLYLIKSTACMAILFLFYKLLLEATQMHVFKRFYLLLALTASLIIPSLAFVEYVEPSVTTMVSTEVLNEPTLLKPVERPTDLDTINWHLIIVTIYCIGLAGFGLRFLKNLAQIIRRVRKNPKLRQQYSIKVLLNEQLPPHTFFRYVFLNKTKFDGKKIPNEVLLHEDVHARQLHSLDVICIELLQVIFWFNPMVFLFKKCIKLNHEFLADSSVLKQNVPTNTYQNALLSYLSEDSETTPHSVSMANAINYSSIKKRFKIMKTETSKKTMLFRSILVLPLFALLLYGFSETEIIEKPLKSQEIVIEQPLVKNIAGNDDAHIISLEIAESGKIRLYNKPIQLSALPSELKKHYTDMTLAERKKILHAKIFAPRTVSLELVDHVDALLEDYGVATIDIIGPTKSSVIKASKQELKRYNGLAKKFNKVPINARVIPQLELQLLERIYRKMSPAQKQMAQPFPECFPEKGQEGASRKFMAEYNTLAKKYNGMDRNEMRILVRDVERLKYIYSLMSDKQKADAEPFPDFPEPPLPPQQPTPPSKESMKKLQKTSKKLQKEAKQLQKESKKLQKEAGRLAKVPVPPVPPKPIDPLDHVIDMAKKGATFYYEGKEISSDRAIKLLKENQSLNISTTNSRSNNPEVRISKEPMKIGKTSYKKKTTLEYAKELEKKNALFYLDEKPINVNKALEIISNKSYDRVETYPYTSRTPEVKIYTKPIKVGSVQKKKMFDAVLGNTISFEKDRETSVAIFQKKNQESNTKISSGFESIIANAKQEAIRFYHKNRPISTAEARELLANNKETSAIISHLKHPELKRLDIITDINKSSKEFFSEQYNAISL